MSDRKGTGMSHGSGLSRMASWFTKNEKPLQRTPTGFDFEDEIEEATGRPSRAVAWKKAAISDKFDEAQLTEYLDDLYGPLNIYDILPANKKLGIMTKKDWLRYLSATNHFTVPEMRKILDDVHGSEQLLDHLVEVPPEDLMDMLLLGRKGNAYRKCVIYEAYDACYADDENAIYDMSAEDITTLVNQACGPLPPADDETRRRHPNRSQSWRVLVAEGVLDEIQLTLVLDSYFGTIESPHNPHNEGWKQADADRFNERNWGVCGIPNNSRSTRVPNAQALRSYLKEKNLTDAKEEELAQRKREQADRKRREADEMERRQARSKSSYRPLHGR